MILRINRIGPVTFLAALLLLLPSSIWAQAGTSTIRGTVTDQTGLVVPGAAVKIVNLNTNFTRTISSSDTGTFNFELIPVGDYRIEVELKGFRKNVVSPVRALVGTVISVDVKLEVGEITSVIEVQAVSTEVQVNTQDATLGNTFVNKQIGQLPMEARNIQALLTLQPGVTGSPDASGYVAGARSDQSNVTLDGVDINEAQSNSLTGVVLRLSTESIEEFRVTTVNPNANQGRSSAAQVNLVTRGGTNDFHGSVYEYHRNTIFTANDFFSNRAGVDRPKLLRNVFGGRIGGPIRKDKLFFFYNYEGRRDASGTAVTSIVPLASMGQGSMRYIDVNDNIQTLNTAQLNAAFPVVLINPAAVATFAQVAARYPANDYTVGDSQSATRLMNTAGFRFNASTPLKWTTHVGKIDWNISPAMSLFVRATVQYDKQTQAPAFPDTPSPGFWNHPWGIVVSHNWTIGRNWVNNFRYGLTRAAFTQQADSADNNINFRFIYVPRLYQRELSRKTPVHNLVNDTSWIKGNHTFNFGTNIRITRNSRINFGSSYDTATTNPSFYDQSGTIVSDAVDTYLAANSLPAMISVSETQNAATALIGRFTQYTARFIFGADGQLLPSGSPTDRGFNTEEYDFYFQDTWRLTRALTLTFGLRYGLSRPVYESKGFGVVTDISGDEYLRRRIEAGYNGQTFNQPLQLTLAGGSGKGGLYNWDKNNFQPRVAVAWSPEFENNILKSIFGSGGKSVLRAGFGITNDYYGQALAVLFDLNNTLGFSSNTTISANTYNITTQPAPLYTGLTQQVRPLPGITVPGPVSFPRQQVSDLQRRIEGGLDTNLVAPINYVFSATFERQLPWGFMVQASYTGRLGRKLLAQRDVMAINNLRDPASGMDWYTAATQLEIIRQTRPPGSTAVPTMAYFDNLFPNLTAQLDAFYGCGGGCMPLTFTPTQTAFFIMRNYYGNDWTFLQDDIDRATGVNWFYNPQYGALSAWGTFAKSNYHGMSISVRQRLRDLTWDLNYTFSHSLDNASGLQNDASYGTSFVLNAIRPMDNYASSDFDLRHQINFSGIYELPFGRGKTFGAQLNRGVDAIIGGWQITSILRWNTGLPLSAPYDDARWATNWNVQSSVTQTVKFATCPTRGNATTAPKLFGCDPTAAYQSFRNAYPGETGQRNLFRLPGYVNLDMGLGKTFTMPWNEKHKLQLRWEVFNVFNHQSFGTIDGSRTGFGMRLDPRARNLTPPTNWSNFTAIQGSPRVMQIGAKFEF